MSIPPRTNRGHRRYTAAYVSDGSVRCAHAECAALIRKRLP